MHLSPDSVSADAFIDSDQSVQGVLVSDLASRLESLASASRNRQSAFETLLVSVATSALAIVRRLRAGDAIQIDSASEFENRTTVVTYQLVNVSWRDDRARVVTGMALCRDGRALHDVRKGATSYRDVADLINSESGLEMEFLRPSDLLAFSVEVDDVIAGFSKLLDGERDRLVVAARKIETSARALRKLEASSGRVEESDNVEL